MSCKGNLADTCGGAGHINIFTAPCNGVPGCNYGYGYISSILGASLSDCNAACHQTAGCVSIQFGTEGSSPSNPTFCNFFKYPTAVVRATGYDNDARCNTFHFYDTTCAL
jgi:hypothetical protein